MRAEAMQDSTAHYQDADIDQRHHCHHHDPPEVGWQRWLSLGRGDQTQHRVRPRVVSRTTGSARASISAHAVGSEHRLETIGADVI
jgi:hypothetical protein